MKKWIALLLTLALALSLCACGTKTEEPAEETTETAAEPAEAEEATVDRVGVLTMLNLSEEEMADYYHAVGLATVAVAEAGKTKDVAVAPPKEDIQSEVVFYDSLDAMLMGLNAGDIDVMSVYNSTADYLVANNDQLVKGFSFLYDPDGPMDFTTGLLRGILSNSFAFMMTEENEALRDEFNEAIASMEADGTLDQLLNEQMLAVVNGGEVKAVEMPVIDGAETIKVAVTGSLPPMDYVSADGTPAGYNTAVLAEISNRIGKNIELVVVDSIGRAAALASGTVDVVFWTRSNDISNEFTDTGREAALERLDGEVSGLTDEQKEVFSQIDQLFDIAAYGQNDMPEGTIITVSYFRDSIVPVMTKAQAEALNAG